MAPRKTDPSASTHFMKTRSQTRRERAEAEATAAAEAAKQRDEDSDDDDDQEESEQGEQEENEYEINSNGKRSRSHSESPSPPKKPRLEGDGSGEGENDEEDDNEDQDKDKDNEGDHKMAEPDEDQGNNAPQHTIIRGDYWPNIRPHFERLRQDRYNGSPEEQLNIEIQVPCCICQNLTLVPFSSEHYPADPQDHNEVTAVLPCGHLIGLDCLTEWRRQSDFLPLPCPQCRHPLDCEDCFVQLRYHVLNDTHVPPPTSSPANHGSRLCNTCHSHDSFIVNTVLMPEIAQPSHGLLRQWIAQEASREYRELRRYQDTPSNTYAATFLNVFSTLRSEANKIQDQLMYQYPTLQRIEHDANNQRPWNVPFGGLISSSTSSSSPDMSNNSIDSFNSTVYPASENLSINSFNSTVYSASENPSIDSFNSTVYPPSGIASIESFNSTVYPSSRDTSIPSVGYDGSVDTSNSSFVEDARWQGSTGESDSDASNGGSSYPDIQYWIDFMRR
ncbi:hypothetical protein CKAH01_06241 [Colletotrichum kahawae]|uniref:RING-type domain-containing protein n=1 Tax=Colletotrichum kahawae TaxID=34407 RepID=A0AAE0D667_COLKA|nr:hypothetical protein CKAH01_06241 [Colletotrichum kahawae]